MYTIQFSTSTKKYFLPESWAEVTPDQLVQFMAICHEEEKNEVAQLRILKSWLQLSTSRFADMAAADNYAQTQELNRFFLVEVEDKLLPIIDPYLEYTGIEHNLIPQLSIPGIRPKVFIGPSHRLENVSAREFSLAIYYYYLYIDSSKEVENLINFVACLYRPQRQDGIKPGHKDYNGDMREPFNPDNIEHIAKSIARVSADKLQAVKFTFERMLKWIGEQPNYEDVFKESKSEDDSFPDYDKIIRSIAGGKYGSIENIRKMPILELFQELQYLEEDYKEAEAQYKSTTPNLDTL